MQQGTSYSQISQDIFALNFFERKVGTFLDLGCGNGFNHPCGNNTLLLEQNGWSGLSIDINKQSVEHFNKNRTTKAIVCDLTQNDLAAILDKVGAPKVIDYLSFDVDEASESVLAKLPLAKYAFSLVTFEHNAYLRNEMYRTLKENAKKRFLSSGYEILIEDVVLDGHGPVEDWFIHSESTRNLPKKLLKNINHKAVLKEYKFV